MHYPINMKTKNNVLKTITIIIIIDTAPPVLNLGA
jgi:hypothetical protein